MKTVLKIFYFINENVDIFNVKCTYLSSYGEINGLIANILTTIEKEELGEVIVSKELFDHLGWYGYYYNKTLHCDKISSDEMYIKICMINDKGRVTFNKKTFEINE